MQKCALALENLHHESAQGLGDGQDDYKENQNVKQADRRHGFSSEFLRAQQGVNQIYEKKQCGNAGDDVVHRIAKINQKPGVRSIQPSRNPASPFFLLLSAFRLLPSDLSSYSRSQALIKAQHPAKNK